MMKKFVKLVVYATLVVGLYIACSMQFAHCITLFWNW